MCDLFVEPDIIIEINGFFHYYVIIIILIQNTRVTDLMDMKELKKNIHTLIDGQAY